VLKNSKADDAKENSRISLLSLNSGKVFCGGSHIRFYCYAHVSFLMFFLLCQIWRRLFARDGIGMNFSKSTVESRESEIVENIGKKVNYAFILIGGAKKAVKLMSTLIWNSHDESGSLALCACFADCPAVDFHHLLYQIEPVA